MGVIHQLKSYLLGNKDECLAFEGIKKNFTKKGKLVYAGQLLRLAYSRYPDSVALVTLEKSITYKELYLRALLLSKKLVAMGIKPHDRVVLFAENSAEFYIAYFAVWQAGGVVVPLNIFLHQRELAYVVGDAEPKAIFTFGQQKEKLEKLYADGVLQHKVPLIDDTDIDWQTPVPEYPEFIEEKYPELTIKDLKPDDMCVLLYTSGTTGTQKGVMLSSRNVMTNTMQAYARFKMFGNLKQERFFCVLPLFHVFAQNSCLWLPVMTGSAVIIVQRIDRRLIRKGLEQKPTMFFGFPALYGLLCMMRNAPLSTIKVFISGADMLPDKIRAAFASVYGRRICSGYGLTEAAPVIAVSYENKERATNVVGQPVVGIACQIRDDQGNVLGPEQIGTLWVKGDNIMLGYYKAEAATQAVLQDGWLNTGDLACIKQDGVIAITGRSKDLIIHKGFNIYPQEVENVLMSHPAVYKAAVVGRDEAVAGQIPVAYVAVKDFDQNLERSLKELCSGNLAAYKVPRKFICLEDLPMNATGKVDKKQLPGL